MNNLFIQIFICDNNYCDSCSILYMPGAILIDEIKIVLKN